MWAFSLNVQASAKNDAEAKLYPEYSVKPRIQNPKILDVIPKTIVHKISIKNIAARYPEAL